MKGHLATAPQDVQKERWSFVNHPGACETVPVAKVKAFPLQAFTGPEGSRTLMLPDFKTIGTLRWYGCQRYAPAAFTSRKCFWYSFLLEAESTPEK
jgi:hypothetical protein